MPKTKKTKKASKKKTGGRIRAAWRKVGCTTCKVKPNTPCISIRGGDVGAVRKPHTTRLARV